MDYMYIIALIFTLIALVMTSLCVGIIIGQNNARKKPIKKIIFVCSPFSGDIENNTKYARLYSKFVIQRGHVPLAPHLLLPQYISEETDRNLALSMSKTFLSRCDELWAFGKNITKGMEEEISEAHMQGIEVKYFRYLYLGEDYENNYM